MTIQPMSRRGFCRAALGGVAAAALQGGAGNALGADAQKTAWYKGNLHMHTYWSDGKAFPEEVIDLYRARGYHFLCLSDHNALQVGEKWLEVGKAVSPEIAERYLRAHGATAVKKEEDGKTFIRLKTVWELKQQFDKGGAFCLFPGLEISGFANRMEKGKGNSYIHMNAINVKDTIPLQNRKTVLETIAVNWEATDAYGKTNGIAPFFMVNHPFWPYFDVQPDDLIRQPQVRFYEMCDGGNRYPPHPDFYSMEGFWDIANAFRLAEGHDLLYGLATDDTHNYFNK